MISPLKTRNSAPEYPKNAQDKCLLFLQNIYPWMSLKIAIDVWMNELVEKEIIFSFFMPCYAKEVLTFYIDKIFEYLTPNSLPPFS